MINKSIVLNSDSYKYSQAFQYPKGTTNVFSYISSRGGEWDNVLFFGLQMFIKEYLKPITKEDIDLAEKIIPLHGLPFYRHLWDYILEKYNGHLPIIIRAVPEGTVVNGKNILLVIENTDEECWWLTSFVETALLRAVWYPTTVATNALESRKIIEQYLEMSGTPEAIHFKLHDFGSRGVSSFESAGIGGLAHQTVFRGTDNITAILYAREFYNESICGLSIPAMEHSTVTSWGRENESKSYENMLNLFASPGTMLAAVSDSYDVFNACENIWGGELKDKVIQSGAMIVIRPDSGDPASVVTKCLKLLDKKFGHTINEKGYKVLNNVRIIQGDGIDHHSIKHILFCAVDIAGFSADNIAFGQGGALLQRLDRDTLKFAMKCSAAKVNGKWVDVFKDPITDQGKRSFKGRLDLIEFGDFDFMTTTEDWQKSALQTYYDTGSIPVDDSLSTIRHRVDSYLRVTKKIA